jgi:hypothetical protein
MFFIIVRDAVTGKDVQVPSLTGHVPGGQVTSWNEGTPLSEAPPEILAKLSNGPSVPKTFVL